MLQYAKALAAGTVSACTALIPVIDDGLTTSEVLYAVVAFLVGTGLVAVVPNKAPDA
jgi:hypothetical protein